MRKRWFVAGLIGYIVLVLTYTLIAFCRGSVPTEPLPLHTVTWQEVGMIKGVVDEEVVARVSYREVSIGKVSASAINKGGERRCDGVLCCWRCS